LKSRGKKGHFRVENGNRRLENRENNADVEEREEKNATLFLLNACQKNVGSVPILAIKMKNEKCERKGGEALLGLRPRLPLF